MSIDATGGCPKCGNCDTVLNVRQSHYGVCHTHRVWWHLGSNLFRSWQHETPETWEENKQILRSYFGVEPRRPLRKHG